MSWLSLTDLLSRIGRCGRCFTLAHPAGDVAFLELDAGFVHGGTGLDLADLDALLVLAADGFFCVLCCSAVEVDGVDLCLFVVFC